PQPNLHRAHHRPGVRKAALGVFSNGAAVIPDQVTELLSQSVFSVQRAIARNRRESTAVTKEADGVRDVMNVLPLRKWRVHNHQSEGAEFVRSQGHKIGIARL